MRFGGVRFGSIGVPSSVAPKSAEFSPSTPLPKALKAATSEYGLHGYMQIEISAIVLLGS